MRIPRILIMLVISIIVSLLIHLLMYGTNFTYQHISDALFVVSGITFVLSVSLMIGAFELLQGLGYTFRVFISPDFRERYSTFVEYKNEKNEVNKSPLYKEAAVSSLVIILIAWILAGVA